MSTTTFSMRKLASIYDNLAKSAEDVLAKVQYLSKVNPVNGLAVARYPSGTSLPMITKVATAFSKYPTLSGCNYLHLPSSHQTHFHLVRNTSDMHKNFEKKQAITGGINSIEVNDLGDFLIVEVKDGVIQEGADFSLYRTKDDFEI